MSSPDGGQPYRTGDEVRCTQCDTEIRLSADEDWRGEFIWRHVITGSVSCHYRATPPRKRPSLVVAP